MLTLGALTICGAAPAQPVAQAPPELVPALGAALQDALNREVGLRVQLIRAEAKAAACSPGSTPPMELKP